MSQPLAAIHPDLRVYACGLDTSATLIARAAELRGVPGKLAAVIVHARRNGERVAP